ncbi:hypothetical protein BT96DRAFT_890163 [Gymnopus androsaceus JB14]|uniref:Uncharacterized protein n=1 Tax=Gymnopus androsaceus JB14 TaxID=1447944 RepID=A0A6A4GV26_9AGAR|nr:hypothetical protein BT96DRAFT_890163 [Gymnopus androsaceus JB14]
MEAFLTDAQSKELVADSLKEKYEKLQLRHENLAREKQSASDEFQRRLAEIEALNRKLAESHAQQLLDLQAHSEAQIRELQAASEKSKEVYMADTQSKELVADSLKEEYEKLQLRHKNMAQEKQSASDEFQRRLASMEALNQKLAESHAQQLSEVQAHSEAQIRELQAAKEKSEEAYLADAQSKELVADSLKEEYEKLQLRLKDLTREKQSVITDYTALRTTVQDLKSSLEHERKLNTASRSALSAAQDQGLRHHQVKLDSLQARNDALEAEILRLQTTPEAIQQRLEETISELEQVKMSHELKIPRLELDIRRLVDSESEAKQSAEKANASLEKLQAQKQQDSDSFSSRIHQLEQENNALRTSGTNGNWVLKSRFEALTNAYTDLKADFLKVNEENYDLQRTHKTVQEELQMHLHSTCPQTPRERSPLTVHLESLQQELRSSHQEKESLQQQLFQAHAENQLLKEASQNLESSRITHNTGHAKEDGASPPSIYPVPESTQTSNHSNGVEPDEPFDHSISPDFIWRRRNDETEPCQSGSNLPPSSSSQPYPPSSSQSSAVPAAAGRVFLAEPKRKTLAHANVRAELYYADMEYARTHPGYKLGPELKPPPEYSSSGGGPMRIKLSQKDKPSPYVLDSRKRRFRWLGRAFMAEPETMNFTETRPANSNKGKQREDVVVDEEEGTIPNPILGTLFGEGSDDDGDARMSEAENAHPENAAAVHTSGESNRSQTKRMYQRCGVRLRGWSVDEQRQEICRVVRHVIREGLAVEQNQEAFVLPGTSDERLQQFARQPDKYGPMLINTTIDITGYTATSEMLDSSWNLALIHNWALLCEEIANTCPDRNRFGQGMQLRDWEKQVTDRLYRIFLAVTKAQPLLENESNDQIKDRIIRAHMERKVRNAKTNSRHVKAKWRADVATAMIDYCRQINDKDGVEFWQYSLRLTKHLGEGGMSEDETSYKTVQVGSRRKKVRVKVIKDLDFRHPSIAAHYEQVEAAPGINDLVFSAAGKHRMERIRISQVKEKRPPEGLSASVYRPGYLENLLPHELAALHLDPNPFPLHQTSNEPDHGGVDFMDTNPV